jgi:hypothetical protein
VCFASLGLVSLELVFLSAGVGEGGLEASSTLSLTTPPLFVFCIDGGATGFKLLFMFMFMFMLLLLLLLFS